jgi:hypothetical protein
METIKDETVLDDPCDWSWDAIEAKAAREDLPKIREWREADEKERIKRQARYHERLLAVGPDSEVAR